jgi:23S rRNA pseudouridine1911/1915/1917 synthase
MKIEVIYEDNHLIVINKPAGVLVQGDETGDEPLLDVVKAYIKNRYNKPGDVYLGVVHRIDRPVSGAVIFARTSKALERMNALFAERKVEKTYWAIVKDRPEPLTATLVNYLDKDKEKNVTKVLNGPSRRHPDAKQAELSYDLMSSMGNYHLLEVHPTTGRSHQIRAQLAHIGCPIRGDVKYGYHAPNADASISLHCRMMTFIHPVQKTPVELVADPPKEQVWNVFAKVMM